MEARRDGRRSVKVGTVIVLAALLGVVLVASPLGTRSARASTPKPILVATTIEQANSGGVNLADRLPGVNVEVYVNGTSTTTGTTTKTAAGSVADPAATDAFGSAVDTDTLIVCVDTPANHTPNGGIVNYNPVADPDNNGRVCSTISSLVIASSNSHVIVSFDYAPPKNILVATTIDEANNGGVNFADRLPGVNVEVYVNGVSTTTGTTTKTAPAPVASSTDTDAFGTVINTDTAIVCADTPVGFSFKAIVVNSHPVADPDNNGRACTEVPPLTIASSFGNVVLAFDYTPPKGILVATTIDEANNGGTGGADRLPGVDIEVYVNGTSATTGITTKTAPASPASTAGTDAFGTVLNSDTAIVCATAPAGYTFNAVVVNNHPVADPDANGRDCTELSPLTIVSSSLNVVVAIDYVENPPTPPVFTKAFDPASILPGNTTTATYTIDNSANATSTDFSFLDPPPAPLIGDTSTMTSDCAGALVQPGFNFSGTAPAVGVCTITIDITGPVTPGSYPTTTTVLTSTKGTAPAASATLTVLDGDPLGFTKQFGPDEIANGAVSTVTFVIDNPNADAAGDLGFVDQLPAGMTVATATTTNTCGGTLIATPGTDRIELVGATANGQATCTVTVEVTAPIGTYTNVTDPLTSERGAGMTATDDLRVLEPVTFTKVFTPDAILDTATTTLRLTIVNPNVVAVTAVGFNDTFPAGMTVADPAALSVQGCVGGTFNAAAGATALTVSGTSVPANTTCVIEVDVIAPGGTHQNTVSDFTSTAGGTPPATATLIVTGTCMGQPATHDMNVLGVNVLTATGGNDVILGTPNADIITALGGNDLVCAGDGDDTVNGDSGNDEIHGEDGDDEIRGGSGQDELHGGDDADEIHGESGRDIIRGGQGRDKAYGGDGNDDIAGGTENDRLEGGPGDDEIHGDEGKDRIHGDEGNDLIRGGDGDDKLYGNQNDDEIHGDDGDDRVNGGHDRDVLHGGDGDDNVRGRSGADEVNGNAGNDSVRGGTGDDVLNGGGGDDNLRAEGGDDELDGGNGTDHCNGGNHRNGDRYRVARCETIIKVEIPF